MSCTSVGGKNEQNEFSKNKKDSLFTQNEKLQDAFISFRVLSQAAVRSFPAKKCRRLNGTCSGELLLIVFRFAAVFVVDDDADVRRCFDDGDDVLVLLVGIDDCREGLLRLEKILFHAAGNRTTAAAAAKFFPAPSGGGRVELLSSCRLVPVVRVVFRVGVAVAFGVGVGHFDGDASRQNRRHVGLAVGRFLVVLGLLSFLHLLQRDAWKQIQINHCGTTDSLCYLVFIIMAAL